MAMRWVPGARSVQVSPEAGDFEALVANLEVREDTLGSLVDAVDEFAELTLLVQPHDPIASSPRA